MKPKVFLMDFDGTISLSDLALFTVERFGGKEWEYYEKLFNENKLSLEDTITAQYSLINAPKETILKALNGNVKIRGNFTTFVNYCSNLEIPVIVVSGGIDFIIRHVLDELSVPKEVEVVSMKVEYQKDGSIKVSKPKRYTENAVDFKQDLARYYESKNYSVYYVGDGSSDYGAVVDVDYTFTVKGSKLSSFCKDKNLNYKEFSDFSEIVNYLKNGDYLGKN